MLTLDITIPSIDFFRECRTAVNCILSGERVVAVVSYEENIKKAKKQTFIPPTIFHIAVNGYVTRIYSGHFGDRVSLRMTKTT
jgi:hypothetical protein